MDYQHRMDKDIFPFLGKKKLTDVSLDILQKHVSYLIEERKLSPRTIKYTFVVLGQALEYARIKKLITEDPSEYVKLPKDEHREMVALTPTQMQLFLERTAQGDVQRHALWTVLLTAGLRPQEACALKWDDFTVTTLADGSEQVSVTIARALKKVGKSQWVIGEVKTKAGKRTLPLPTQTWAALKPHKARQASEILRKGDKYNRQGFVFASRKRTPGAFLDIGTVRRWWKKALGGIEGMPVVRLYDSRHSHITALLAGGVHPKIAQERAGHSSIKVTMDTYSHVIPGMQQAAAELVGGLLFKTGT
jgi:integrase